MLPQDVRFKLSELNRLRVSGHSRGALDVASGRETEACPFATHAESCSLESILPGRVHQHEAGTVYVVERALEHLYPSGHERVYQSLDEIRRHGLDPKNTVFLDVETCGLANCPLFLAGLLSLREDGIRVQQLFARDYSEEVALLANLRDAMARYSALVTFNGRSYDVPYILDRMTFHRLNCDFNLEHLDLLHHARRRWKENLPDCRLQTLEEHICGRRRVGDAPGYLIPTLYHDFVRTGNAALIEGVFHHNAIDLITMVELLPFL